MPVIARMNTNGRARKGRARLNRRSLLSVVAGALAAPAIARAAAVRPNIVLIVSDDQSKTTLALGMRKTRARTDLVWYENACATGLVCATARTSLYTGQYDFRHGITNNLLAWQFDYTNWLLSWAKDAGYVTGFYGKMINDYPNGRSLDTCVPACADWWEVFFDARAHMFNYTLVEKRGPLSVPATYFYPTGFAENYSTDLLKVRASNFINRYAGQRAFFLVVAPYNPHDGGAPAPRYTNAFFNLDMVALRPASFNVVGAKQPPWLRAEPPLFDPGAVDESRRDALRSTLALDDMVAALLATLGAVGQLNNTLFIFTTDQSVASGEHRLMGKHHAYGSTTDVPLAIRWPGGGGGTSDQLVTHTDLTATICAMAGLTPGLPLDGVDIRANARSDALLHWAGGDNGGRVSKDDSVPAFWGLRTAGSKYVRLQASGFEELYVLPGDEIDNVAGNPAYAAVRSSLAARLAEQIP